jgi:ferredoxin
MKKTVNITIKCGQKKSKFVLRQGLGLQAIPPSKDNPLEFDCRKADCGICIIAVLAGSDNLSPKTPVEDDFLKAMHADAMERLACQCRVHGDVVIDVATF